MTQADDLPALGFDAASARTAMLPPAEILRRFPDTRQSAIADCVHAGLYCTGFVFPAANKAKVTLLVMNGRVVHKVIDGREPAPGLTPAPLRKLAALARDFL
ncbi:MAG: hypothetical protein EON47_20860 [Acetobacteraceae bacterium]|nr:MAG: hypothetical protein EON47_20860 [Acetobacteraceae bacterium]